MIKKQFKPNRQLKNKVQACLSKNFLRIPKSICGIKILSSTKLNLPEKIILSEIISFQSQGRISTIGMRFILKEFNIPRGTASRAIDTLLGHQSKKDKRLGIKRLKILIAKPIYWKNSKKNSIRARQLLINPHLINNFIHFHPNILNKYLFSQHIPKKERMKRVNLTRKLTKDMSQSKKPRKSPLSKGVSTLSKNKEYTPFHSGTPTSTYFNSNFSEVDDKAYQSGTPLFHGGTPPYHSGTHAYQSGTPPYHDGTHPFHSGTNKSPHKSRDNIYDKKKSSSSSSSVPSEDSNDEDDDDETLFNSKSTPKSGKELSVSNGSLHKADSESHGSLNKISARANVSEYPDKNVSRKTEEGSTNVEAEFINIISEKLIKVFPKLEQNETTDDIVSKLTHRYGRDNVQKGAETVITRSDNVRTPLPYLNAVVSNLSKETAKENGVGDDGDVDPYIPGHLTPNQWKVLDNTGKRRVIREMMIRAQNRRGSAYIESFIKRYNLRDDSFDLSYSKIEEEYRSMALRLSLDRYGDTGQEFNKKLDAGKEKAIKKRYFMFTSARLRVWTANDYKFGLDDLVEIPNGDFAKEERKIEEFDSDDINQLSVDKVVYGKFMKHLATSKIKAKKLNIEDERRKQKKQNLKFYHKKFSKKHFEARKHKIMEVWASHVPNSVMVSIYNHQFKDKPAQQCTANEIFTLLKDGLEKHYPNKLTELKIKSN